MKLKTSLLAIFLYFACFFSSTTTHKKHQPKLRKISPASSTPPPNLKPSKSTSIHSYIKIIISSLPKLSFTLKQPREANDASSQSFRTNEAAQTASGSVHGSFTAREIYPCTTCGEILSKRHVLDVHNINKHSLSQLSAADSGYNVLHIIFHSRWKGPSPPAIHCILKINNSPRALEKFEDYRDTIRAHHRNGGDARCAADGNERLQFHCSMSLCSLSSGELCSSPYCGACGIVRHGFSGKNAEVNGIGTHETSWGAHVALHEDLEREFEYLNVRRVMVVCRVVAGKSARSGEEEVLVYSQWAVLPCFLVVYSVL